MRDMARHLIGVSLAAFALLCPGGSAAATLEVKLAPSLDAGPWLYYKDSDTVAVAGHRTTHSAPFRHLDNLRTGDIVILDARVPAIQVRYRVVRSTVVPAEAVWVLNWKGLVLSACSRPDRQPTSGAYRLVVFAKEVTA